jgi:hypothetical protein
MLRRGRCDFGAGSQAHEGLFFAQNFHDFE